jgi:hypothetical protein
VKTSRRRRRNHRRPRAKKPAPPAPPPPAEPASPQPTPPAIDAYELALWYRQAWCARHYLLAERFLAQLKDLAKSPQPAKEAAFEEPL